MSSYRWSHYKWFDKYRKTIQPVDGDAIASQSALWLKQFLFTVATTEGSQFCIEITHDRMEPSNGVRRV